MPIPNARLGPSLSPILYFFVGLTTCRLKRLEDEETEDGKSKMKTRSRVSEQQAGTASSSQKIFKDPFKMEDGLFQNRRS